MMSRASRSPALPRWVGAFLASAVAVVVVGLAGLVVGEATASAVGTTYAYDTAAYVYAAPARLLPPDTVARDVRGSPSGPGAASWGRSVSVGGDVVAANTARVAPPPTGSSSASSPTFIGFADGPPAIVPQGAVGPTLTRGPGVQYTGGSGGLGLHPNTSGVRIMDQTAHHAPRVVYMNQTGQTINPVTGRTVPNSDPWAHLPW